jgi:hypothetical protein
VTSTPDTPSTFAEGSLKVEGVCHALYAYDVGLSIDLAECERLIDTLKQREPVKHKHRAPEAYLDPASRPLRVPREASPIVVGRHQTQPLFDMVVHDFGAVTVNFGIDIVGPFGALQELGQLLYENDALRAASLKEIERLIEKIAPAVQKPNIAATVEDYVIYEVRATSPPVRVDDLVTQKRLPLAQLLRAEAAALSDEEVDDALSCRLSFGRDDLAIVDWNAAFLLDRDADDVRSVLELVNAELLEMRYLDRQLDERLERAYEAMVVREEREGWRFPSRPGSDLRRIARLQVDSAILFERINNALKLIGDQYLARVYRRASQRFHLQDWDATVQRKLQTLESIYQKLTDRISTRRLELLEWIIILLIAASILLSLI